MEKKTQGAERFNLTPDPAESNLAKAKPDRLEQLRAKVDVAMGNDLAAVTNDQRYEKRLASCISARQ